jgi:hypothetical protein
MRPGGGQAKGAAWERKAGVYLSLWVTEGQREDIFSRNVLSGGRFTNAVKAGKDLGTPGDLMAAHPLAFDFLSLFLVECKHTASIQLDQYIFDKQGKTWLSKVITKAAGEAKTMSLNYMVIAMQNRKPPLLFMPAMAGMMVRDRARPKGSVAFHRFHNDTVFCCTFEDFVRNVKCIDFLAAMPPKGPRI